MKKTKEQQRRRSPGILSSPLSRRTVLRGAGAAIALPLLDAMWPTMARAQENPLVRPRFLSFYVPNGMHMASWTPATNGSDYTLTPILEPLAPFRNKTLVLSGLHNRPGRPDGPGDHAAGTGSFLTATHCNKSETILGNGQSIDQRIAEDIGQTYRFPSLVLGAEGGGNAGGCDSGYSCAYSRNISWVNETTPAARETIPQSVFDRLFGVQGSQLDPETRRKEARYRRGILDFVLEDVRQLERKLGPQDRRKLDEHLTGIRELERQIQLTQMQQCDPGARPERPDDFRQTITQMIDLMVMACRCELTPVISFMLGNAGSYRPFPFLGIPDGHHQLSHHQGNPERHRKLEQIGRWEVEQFAYLLNGLASIQEAGGTGLDNAILYFSSEISDGQSHSHWNMPVLVAGGAGGQLEGGRHITYPGGREDGPSVADLFLSIAGLCGVPLERFGDDSRGPLSFG